MVRFEFVLLFLNLIAISSVLSQKRDQFCEKDDKTGLCKEPQEDEDEPCWYKDPDISATEKGTEEPEQKEFGKLHMIDGVKVSMLISNVWFSI